MARNFLIPFGIRKGHLVDVSDVKRGLACDCHCPICGKNLIARKGNHVSHHFAHAEETACQGETVFHELGKLLLHERLTIDQSTGIATAVEWQCPECGGRHRGNLTAMATEVGLEQTVGPCRPDVVVMGQRRPMAFLEIVVSHEPEEEVRQYAARRRIPLFEFHISEPDDLRAIRHSSPLSAKCQRHCLLPRCPSCSSAMSEKQLEVIAVPCWKCKKTMRAARICIGATHVDPESFSVQEKRAARDMGVLLKRQYSHTTKSHYVANTCPGCSGFIGAYHLFENHHDTEAFASKGLGFGCERCS